MWLLEQKADMFVHKLKPILLPQLIATLNNYACSMPLLANVDWSVFPKCFLPTMWIHDWWNDTKGVPQFGCDNLIWLPLSVHIFLCLVVEYWPLVGTWTHHRYSKLYYLCHLVSLFKLLPSHTSPPRPSCPCPYIRWPNINEFHEKIIKTGKNQPLSTCQVSCTKLLDN